MNKKKRLPVVNGGDGSRIFAEFRATKITILTGSTVGRTIGISDIVSVCVSLCSVIGLCDNSVVRLDVNGGGGRVGKVTGEELFFVVYLLLLGKWKKDFCCCF